VLFLLYPSFQDEIWRHHVIDWLERQDPRSGAPTTAGGVAATLNVATLRGAYQVLHCLRAWPTGMWSCVEPPWYPQGILVRVVQAGATFRFGFVFPTNVPPPSIWPNDATEYRVSYAMKPRFTSIMMPCYCCGQACPEAPWSCALQIRGMCTLSVSCQPGKWNREIVSPQLKPCRPCSTRIDVKLCI